MTERYDEFADEQITHLYQETSVVEPPEWLDRRILMVATAAVTAPSPVTQALPKRRNPRWLAPLALAATVILTVGLVRLMYQSGELQAPLRSEAAKSWADQEAKEDSPAKQRADSVSADAHLQSAPEALAPPIAEMPTSQVLGKTIGSSKSAAAPLPSTESNASSLVAPAAPTTSSAVPAASVPTASASRQRRAVAESQKKLETLEIAPATKPAESETADQSLPGRRSPQQWLQAIAELRRQGRITEANAELAQFKRHYPNHPLDLDQSTR